MEFPTLSSLEESHKIGIAVVALGGCMAYLYSTMNTDESVENREHYSDTLVEEIQTPRKWSTIPTPITRDLNDVGVVDHNKLDYISFSWDSEFDASNYIVSVDGISGRHNIGPLDTDIRIPVSNFPTGFLGGVSRAQVYLTPIDDSGYRVYHGDLVRGNTYRIPTEYELYRRGVSDDNSVELVRTGMYRASTM